MSGHLARNIYHLLRGAAKRTTLDDLRREGRKNLSVLHFRDVEALIEKAVENTLKRRGLDPKAPGMHEEVRLEFLALMRERDLLARTVDDLVQQRERLAENKQRLDEALSEAADEYAHTRDRGVQTEAEHLDQLAERLEQQLAVKLTGIEPEAKRHALALVRQAFAEQRAISMTRAEEAQAERLSQLQRRMARLKAKLDETEEMLAKAQSQSDSGRSPIPGDPIRPGLDAADPSFETKKELLREIFRLNVELKEMLDKN